MTPLVKALSRHAAANPERVAIDPVTGSPVSYSRLVREVHTLAGHLQSQFEAGRPVALQTDHGPDEVLLELALLEAGLPILSLPRFFTPEQAGHAITTCGAQALFVSSPMDRARECRTAPVPLPRGTARITFTSGSTGTPKGVCLSSEHMLLVAQSVIATVGAEHAGRHLALLPPGILLETVAGLYPTLLAGGTYVCPPQQEIGLAEPFRPQFRSMAQAIADLRITSLILVPEYLAGLVGTMEATGLRLPFLTLVAVGGAPTQPELLLRARALGLPVRQGYGLTESASVVSLETCDFGEPGSVGHPLEHLHLSIAPDGEVLVDGPAYLGTIGIPRDNGPLHTGDIGRIDSTGRLWIEGRKSNLIVTSHGRNISPEWIEQALLAQPGVLQAMVHGDGRPAPEALLVPSSPDADLAQAVAAANATLPAYAQIAGWREAAHFTPHNGQLTGNGRLRRDAIAAAYCNGETGFMVELEAATIRERLRFLQVPQLQAGLSGTISREAYIAYLTQAYHHVRHTVPLLSAARDRLVHRRELAAALDGYIAEEAGHDEWILSDIAAAGGNAEEARSSEPAAATSAMIEHAFEQIRNGNPVALFGMVFVLESVSVALAQRGASAVAERLGLPPEAFTYLTSHGALDQDHMRYLASLVNSLDRHEDREAILRMARDMFSLYGAVFASVDLEHALVPA